MGKGLLYRWFGYGKIPSALRAELEREGLISWDEGGWMALRFRKYKSPRMYSGRGIKHHPGGWVALSQTRLVIKGYWEYSSIRFDKMTSDNLQYGVREGQFFVAFLAEAFHADRRGHIEHCYSTETAPDLVRKLDELRSLT